MSVRKIFCRQRANFVNLIRLVLLECVYFCSFKLLLNMVVIIAFHSCFIHVQMETMSVYIYDVF